MRAGAVEKTGEIVQERHENADRGVVDRNAHNCPSRSHRDFAWSKYGRSDTVPRTYREKSQMRRIVIGVIVGLSLATSAWAEQSSRLDEIIKRGSLRVGMTGDY